MQARAALLVLALLALHLPGPGEAAARPTMEEARARAVEHLRAAFPDEPDESYVFAWGTAALASVGEEPARFRRDADGPSILERLEAQDVGTNAYDLERHVLGAVAALRDPARFGGVDLAARLLAHHVGGQMGDVLYVNDDIYGVFALHATGLPPSHAAVRDAARHVRQHQQVDGSWSHVAAPVLNPAAKSPDLTAAAICALRLAGDDPSSEPIRKALAWLESAQRADGGFPLHEGGSPSTPQSTAWVLMGLRCAGENPSSPRWTRGGATPLTWLLDRQGADGGWNGSPWDTAVVLQALSGRDYPLYAWMPVAFSFAPAAPTRATDVRFEDASGRADARAWRWDFADGATADGRAATRRFATLGPQDVTLTVWGAGRYAGRATATLDVANALPRPIAAASAAEVPRGAEVRLDGGASSDADGRVVQWRWDFGDGASTGWRDSPEAAHAYARLGAFYASLYVKDDDGAVAGPSRVRVDVVNRAPTVAFSVAEVRLDRATPFDLAPDVADPDGDTVTLHWDLGDGDAAPPHVYARPGAYDVAVVARDAHGGEATARVRVVVENAPPRVLRVEAEPASPVAGRPVRLAVVAEDADDAALVATWTLPGGASATGAATRWTPAAAGPVRVAVVVRDAWGAEAAAELALDVGPAPAGEATSSAGGDAPAAAVAEPDEEIATGPDATAAGDAPRPNARPWVRVVAPESGATVEGDLVLALEAGDPDGRVAAVVLFVDGAPHAAAPDGDAWTLLVPAERLPRGAFTVTARAVDELGLESAPASVALAAREAPEALAASTSAERGEAATAEEPRAVREAPGVALAAALSALAAAALTRAPRRRA